MAEFATVQTHRGGQQTYAKKEFWRLYHQHFHEATLEDVWSAMERDGRYVWFHRGILYRLLDTMGAETQVHES